MWRFQRQWLRVWVAWVLIIHGPNETSSNHVITGVVILGPYSNKGPHGYSKHRCVSECHLHKPALNADKGDTGQMGPVSKSSIMSVFSFGHILQMK